MRLIQAFVMAQHVYGEDGNWQAIHMGSALSIERKQESVYQDASYEAHDGGVGLICGSDRLEVVLAAVAERYPAEVQDEQWRVSLP